MSEMLTKESWERFWEGLGRAASCCRELHCATKIKDWDELSKQLLIARDKGRVMYKAAPLQEVEVICLVDRMHQAQVLAEAMKNG